MPSIRLKGVDFSYPVQQLADQSIKMALLQNFVGSRLAARGSGVEVNALVGVDLEVNKGERLGIIGRNGSGKSTLLLLLAGLLRPNAGEIDVKGRIVSAITPGLGVSPERTGRQNIELPLRLLGATDEEVRRAQETVPAWTGLGSFIDLPVRTYSDGMRARLTFALSTAVRGDIFILDEWLNAGDADFVNKARRRMRRTLSDAGIVVVCSHSMSIIETMCSKVVWLDQGRVVMTGRPRPVIYAYKKSIVYSRAASKKLKENREKMRVPSDVVPSDVPSSSFTPSNIPSTSVP